jgi:iron complex transport system permease protein
MNQKTYKGYVRYKKLFLLLLGLLTVFAALVAVSAGSSGLSLITVIKTLFGLRNYPNKFHHFQYRCRGHHAIVAGTGLASVGCVMQSLLKNPLASASTLGIAQAPRSARLCHHCLGAGMQNQTLTPSTSQTLTRFPPALF